MFFLTVILSRLITTAYLETGPVLLAAPSKTRTVFDSSSAGIVGLNPARGMDVYPRLSVFVLSCVGSGLAVG
jgi:hypothetical protein